MTEIPTPDELKKELLGGVDERMDGIVENILAKMRETLKLSVCVEFKVLDDTAEEKIRERLEAKGWDVDVVRTQSVSTGFFTFPGRIEMKVRPKGHEDDDQ